MPELEAPQDSGPDLAGSELPVNALPAAREADEAGSHAAARFYRITEVIQAGVYEYDLRPSNVDGVSWISSSYVHLLGYRPEGAWRVAERFWDRHVHADDQDLVEHSHRRFIAAADASKTLALEYRLLKKDGAPIWISERAGLVLGSSGQPEYLVGIIEDITDRVERQQALARERLLRERTLTYMPAAVYAKDPKTLAFTHVNCEAAHCLGFAPEALLGHRLSELDDSDAALAREQADRDALAAGITLQEREESCVIDGKRHVFHVRRVSLTDADGHPEQLLGVATDVTEVHALRSRLESILENVPVAVLVLTNGRVSFANESALRELQYTDRELSGLALPCLVPGLEEPEAFKALWNQSGRDAARRRHKVLRRDGTHFPAEVRLGRFGNEHEMLLCLLNRTELERHERAVKEQQEILALERRRLRVAIDSVGMGVWDWGVGDESVRWDRGMRSLYGVGGRGKVTHASWLERVHPFDQPALENCLRDAMATKARQQTEMRVKRSDGTERVVLCAVQPVLGADDKVLRLVGVNQDITAFKKAEAKLARSARKLRRLNRELNQFTSMASHDLRNPIRQIRAFADILASESKDPSKDAEEAIHFIKTAASELQDLVGGLLSLARLERSKEEFVDVDVGAMVDRVVQRLGQVIEDSGAKVDVGPLGHACADPALLPQVFQNLIQNALKFRDEQRPLRVEVGRVDEGGRARFYVSDTGIGIAPQNTQRIFEAFRRAHGGKFEGLGLGLAMVRKIIDLHGGRIWVESKVGKGSVFWFALDEDDGQEGSVD